MAALEAKAIDSAMLQRVATKVMTSKGFYPLLNMNQAKIPYQNTGLAMRRDFAAANPTAVDGVCRAVIEAYGFIFNKENKQAVKESIARNLRLPNVDAAEDFYQEALEGARSKAVSVPGRNPNRYQIRRRTKSQGRVHQGR